MFESKRRALIFMSLSFVLAAVAGIIFYSKYQDLNDNLGKMTDVYVADANIPSRKAIEPSDVSSTKIPNKYVTDAHILSMDQLEDQVLIIPLKEGDLITENILKPYTELTSQDNRLVEIMTSAEGNDNITFDDDFDYMDQADIVVSYNFDETDDEETDPDKEPVTELFMTDVPVHKVFKGEEGQTGIAVEVQSDRATGLIHMLNYADYIHVLKSGAGEDEGESEQGDEETQDTNPDEGQSENEASEEEQEEPSNDDNETSDNDTSNEDNDTSNDDADNDT